ncbi:MAG: hypothetical protein LH468_13615 [Nocardioides sp.]|nr:hypothetical protein [Nocardioides sp.]
MRTTVRRTALGLAGLALTVGGFTGCGGDDDSATGGAAAPDDTSTEDFCGSYAALIEETARSFSPDAEAADLVPTLKEFATQLAEVGTPSTIPDDARRGFELSIDAINDLPDDATQEELLSQAGEYSAEQQADATAFATYVQAECPDALSGVLPSDAPTDGAG